MKKLLVLLVFLVIFLSASFIGADENVLTVDEEKISFEHFQKVAENAVEVLDHSTPLWKLPISIFFIIVAAAAIKEKGRKK